MSDSCRKCSFRCHKWYEEQIELMAQDPELRPMHCLIVALVQSVSIIRENHGYAIAHAFAQRIADQVETGLDVALNVEKEVMQDR